MATLLACPQVSVQADISFSLLTTCRRLGPLKTFTTRSVPDAAATRVTSPASPTVPHVSIQMPKMTQSARPRDDILIDLAIGQRHGGQVHRHTTSANAIRADLHTAAQRFTARHELGRRSQLS